MFLVNVCLCLTCKGAQRYGDFFFRARGDCECNVWMYECMNVWMYDVLDFDEVLVELGKVIFEVAELVVCALGDIDGFEFRTIIETFGGYVLNRSREGYSS